MLFYFSLLNLVLIGEIFADSTQEEPDNSCEKPVNNPEEGPYFEGDIILPQSMKRNGVIREISKWPKGIVPFEISDMFTDEGLKMIFKAMNTISNHTCITFRLRNKYDKDYVRILNKYKGCFASLGRNGGPQDLNLYEPDCVEEVGVPMHELLHALGIFHEHSRYDRDRWVKVIKENIKKNMTQNFEKLNKRSATTFGLPYDYNSVMHYGRYAFSVDKRKPTIVPRYPSVTLGQREKLSEWDIKKIKIMYKCPRSRYGY